MRQQVAGQVITHKSLEFSPRAFPYIHPRPPLPPTMASLQGQMSVGGGSEFPTFSPAQEVSVSDRTQAAGKEPKPSTKFHSTKAAFVLQEILGKIHTLLRT